MTGTSVALRNTRLFANFRYALFATEVLLRCNRSLRVNKGLSRFANVM
jgi:hypothetical protein